MTKLAANLYEDLIKKANRMRKISIQNTEEIVQIETSSKTLKQDNC